MSKVKHISDAIVRGGITDGQRTVFYSDVRGVEVKKGKRRSCGDWIAQAIAVPFVVVSLGMICYSFENGNYGGALTWLLCGLFFGTFILLGETVWVVTVLTPSGKIKLFFPRPFWEAETECLFPDWLDWLKSDVSHDLGPKVSEVLIRRKGQPDSHKNHDLKFSCEHDSEGKSPPFFKIDGDCIHVLDYDYDEKPVVKDTARLDGLVAAEKSRKYWEYGKFSRDYVSRRNEVLLRFDTGDTTTHYVLHYIWLGPASNPALEEDPADELVKALEEYIKSHSSGS